MPTTLQPKILLVTLKYDFKVIKRENSPNEVQKWYPRGTMFFGLQTVRMGYYTPKWGTVGNPGYRLMKVNLTCLGLTEGLRFGEHRRKHSIPDARFPPLNTEGEM